MDVDQLGIDAHLFQNWQRLHSLPNKVTTSEDGYIAAFLQHLGLADDEFLVSRSEVRHFRATEAQVNRTIILGSGYGSSLGLVEVARHDDGHVGQHLHQSNVLEDLVRGTVFTEGHARMRSSNFHVLVGISHTLADLVVYTSRREGCEGTRERHETAQRHASCHIDHVGFGDTRLEETLGKLLGEVTHFD